MLRADECAGRWERDIRDNQDPNQVRCHSARCGTCRSAPVRSVSTLAVCTQPGCPVLVPGKGRCSTHGKPAAPRPSTTAQGYGARWRAVRDPFIAAHPQCQGDGTGQHHPSCDGRATVADHDPLTRRELVARGDPNPDAWHHLVARSGVCHSRKTALFDGAFGNSPKTRGEGGSDRGAR